MKVNNRDIVEKIENVLMQSHVGRARKLNLLCLAVAWRIWGSTPVEAPIDVKRKLIKNASDRLAAFCERWAVALEEAGHCTDASPGLEDEFWMPIMAQVIKEFPEPELPESPEFPVNRGEAEALLEVLELLASMLTPARRENGK